MALRALRAKLNEKTRNDNFPFAVPFALGLFGAGVAAYYIGTTTSARNAAKYHERLERYTDTQIENHRRVREGNFNEFTPSDIVPDSKDHKGLIVGTLVATAMGSMLYKNWDRQSLSMTLIHTRVMGQALVITGLVGLAGRQVYLDKRRKAKENADTLPQATPAER